MFLERQLMPRRAFWPGTAIDPVARMSEATSGFFPKVPHIAPFMRATGIRHCEQSRCAREDWIASSQMLLAMTRGLAVRNVVRKTKNLILRRRVSAVSKDGPQSHTEATLDPERMVRRARKSALLAMRSCYGKKE